MMKYIALASILLLAGTACKNEEGTPRPRAFPRIEYPERSYNEYDQSGCPFTFEYPAYGQIEAREDSCWFDIYMKTFEARLHCSYFTIEDRAHFDDLVRDAFRIATKINERANFMQEMQVGNNHGVRGLSLSWTGPAASPIHFFLSDTTDHFFRASLYFDSKVKPDSLAPVVDFIKTDINRMISSFQWKDE